MKKGLSIIVLIVFLFNVGGHYLVFWGLRFQTDQKVSGWIDAEKYHPGDLIELKIPVSLPYPIYQTGYERVEGIIEHNGEFFRLVKQKYESDTVYVLCVRDVHTEHLVNVMNDYLKKTQPVPASPVQNKTLQFLGKLFTDFYTESVQIVAHAGYCLELLFDSRVGRFQCPLLLVLAPPPRG